MHQNQTKQQSFSIDVAVAFTGLERTCLFCKWQKKNSVDQCDVVSDSSGVGTSNSGSGGSYDATPSDHSTPIGVAGVGAGAGGASQLNVVLPGMTVVCIEPYASKEPGHLHLMPGDIIEGGSTRFQLPFFWSTWVCLIFLFPWNAAYWKARDDLNIAFFCFISS